MPIWSQESPEQRIAKSLLLDIRRHQENATHPMTAFDYQYNDQIYHASLLDSARPNENVKAMLSGVMGNTRNLDLALLQAIRQGFDEALTKRSEQTSQPSSGPTARG